MKAAREMWAGRRKSINEFGGASGYLRIPHKRRLYLTRSFQANRSGTSSYRAKAEATSGEISLSQAPSASIFFLSIPTMDTTEARTDVDA